MSRRLVFLAVWVLVAAARPWGQEQKLSGSLAREEWGDVTGVEPSPDGTRLVYLARPTSVTRQDLYSVPRSGGTARRLNDAQLADRIVSSFLVDPTSAWVVYLCNKELKTRFDLYTVPIDGGVAPVRLNTPAAGSVSRFEISPDGARVVFTNPAGLFAVPLAGGTAQELDGSLTAVAAGNAPRFLLDRGLAFFFVSSNSGRALCSVPIDASAPPTVLTGAMFTGFQGLDPHPYTVRISADGARAVYLGDHGLPETADLFSVPVNGSASPVVIDQEPDPYQEISTGYSLTADGRVLFTRSRTLFIAPIDGSAPAAVLDAHATATIRSLAFAPDDSRFVVARDHGGALVELRAGPLVPGSGAALLAQLPSGYPREVRFSSDAQWVVFEGPGESLFSVPSDGTQAPVAVSGTLAARYETWWPELGFEFAPDGEHVVFGAADPGGTVAGIYMAPLDGGAPPVCVHEDLAPYGDAEAFRLTSLGDVVYLADQDRDGVIELYAVPMAASSPAAPLNLPFTLGSVVGRVDWHRITPDGNDVVYIADEDRPVNELYAVSLRDGQGRRKLSGELPESTYVMLAGTEFPAPVIAPDGSRVLYVISGSGPETRKLMSAPLDGASPPVELTQPPLIPKAQAPLFTSGEVFFLAWEDELNKNQIHGVPADGSAPSRLVVQAQCSTLDAFLLSDGAAVSAPRLVYVDCSKLMSVRTDLAAPAVQLSPTPFGTASVAADYQLTPDETRVVFRCPVTSSQPELRAAPVDGGAPSVALNGSLELHAGEFQISPDGARVAFDARTPGGKWETYIAPLDGSAPPLQLSPGQGNTSDSPRHCEFSPDSAYAVFTAQSTNILYGVPVDRSTEPVRLSVNGDVSDRYFFLPDGRTVVFLARQHPHTQYNLYRVPVTGGSQVLLTSPARYVLDANSPVLHTADGRWIVYLGVGRRPLAVPTRGARRTVFLSAAPDPVMNGVVEFSLAPDDHSVIFRAHMQYPLELFQSDITRRVRSEEQPR